MKRKQRTGRASRAVAAAAVAAALALTGAGCSTKAEDAGGGGKAGADGVKTGPGVTGKTVKLAALTDLSGPYATLGKSIVQAQQLWADEFNEAGGVCGRKVEIVVKDHGYDVQKAQAAYTEVSPDVIAMPQVIGSPVVASLQDAVERDKILTFPQAWAASLLGREAVQIVGTTYDIDMISAVDFLTREQGLKKGDKIGHVFFEGDYGENALEGSRYAAKGAGLTVVDQKIKASDTDLSAQVTAL
ncbi:ABC transporter substrate-binding protein, partial [Streptomyces sp. NPDC048845]